MKIFKLCVVLLLTASYAFSQDQRIIDSLQKILSKNDIADTQKVDIYNLLANEFRYTDSVKVAHYTTPAIRLAKKTYYFAGIADAYYHIGWVAIHRGHYAQAIKTYRQVLQIAQKHYYLKGQANAYNGLGVTFANQGNYTKALGFHQKSLKIKQEIGYQDGIAYSYNNMGLVYRSQGNYSKALDLHQRSLKIKQQTGNQSGIAYSYNNMGLIQQDQGNYPEALKLHQKSLKIREQIGDRRGIALTYSNIGFIYYNQGHYAQALKIYQKALKIREQIENKRGIASVYNAIGNTYDKQGNRAQALKVYEKALKINTQIGEQSGVATSYLNLGKLAMAQQALDKAHEYFRKALTMRQQLGEKDLSAEAWINLGIAYHTQKDYPRAWVHLEKGTQMALQTGNPRIVRDGAQYLSKVYQSIGKYQLAYKNLELFKQMADSLFSAEIIRQVTRLESSYATQKREDSLRLAEAGKRALLKANLKQHQITQRATFVGLALSAALLLTLLVFYRNKQRSNHKLSKANEEIVQQQQKLQIQHTRLTQTYQDVQLLTTIGREITSYLDPDKVFHAIHQHMSQLMMSDGFGLGIFNAEKREIDFRLALDTEPGYQSFQRNMTNKNQFAVWCIENRQPIASGDLSKEHPRFVDNQPGTTNKAPQSAIHLPLIVQNRVVGVLYVQSVRKNAYTDHHLNLLKNLSLYVAIAIDNARIYQQLDKKNQDIMASLTYARRIQKAILPLDDIMKKYLQEHFVLFRPRDIVSGDFYWCDAVGNKVFMVAADCTGHGVPGAFMTMISLQALNHVVIQNKLHTPDLVLLCLDGILKQILKSENTMVRDGMDMAFCVVDKEKKTLSYSGAKIPLVLVQNKQIQEIPGSLFSINGHRRANGNIEFSKHTIDISEPTSLYVYSDGYQDQFGGERGKKFMKKRFRQLLHEVSDQTMDAQGQMLENTLNKWMTGHEQIDDILVMGVRL